MTALETLQKYGLKTDVKSIRGRLEKDIYWSLACQRFTFNGYADTPDNESDIINRFKAQEFARDAKAADLSLLCSLAEKGKRYEKAVKDRKQEAQRFIHTMHEFYGNTRFWGVTIFKEHIKVIDKIITEAEGKRK